RRVQKGAGLVEVVGGLLNRQPLGAPLGDAQGLAQANAAPLGQVGEVGDVLGQVGALGRAVGVAPDPVDQVVTGPQVGHDLVPFGIVHVGHAPGEVGGAFFGEDLAHDRPHAAVLLGCACVERADAGLVQVVLGFVVHDDRAGSLQRPYASGGLTEPLD